ncbi:hypothetical protein W822_08285 [Advenella kashmirensis W13003]|uniref:Addiction module toxin, HicA family n=1 Tax=Advenella kashmirensis W13003 TaxID=1424334 RepID=V8QS71_9BURK|nr:type II toxin-antitoxin system HicA family toxin [Advenella kashmirensis]ETF02826.1 hypothetical protein W822_08285 [Advenella kashmirensis W13003]
MKSSEVIKLLKADGWVWVGGKGDHMKFKHPMKAGHVVVPHPRKDVPWAPYVVSIARQAGSGGPDAVPRLYP